MTIKKFLHKNFQLLIGVIFVATATWVFVRERQLGGVVASGTPAADTFARSVSSGWGSADTGGSWTTTGTGISTSADFNVDGSAATASVTAANQNKTALLTSISSQDFDATVRVKVDKVATGSTEVMYLIGRRISNGNEYRGRMLFNTNGSVTIQATSLVTSTETTLGAAVTVPGLTHSADAYIRFRFAVSGVNPTTLSMKAWADGDSEPGSWQYTTTDTASVLQAAGAAGLQARLSTTVTNAPVLFTFDDYVFTDNDPSPSPTPTPSPSPSPPSAGADTFTRSVTDGWGSADTGGSYSVSPIAANFDVAGSEGTMSLPSAGSSYYAMLNSLSMTDPDMKIKVKIDKVPTSATNADAGVALIGRRLGSDEYRGRLKFSTAGTTSIIGTKLVGGVETNIGTAVTVSGLAPTADTYVWLRFRVLGTNPTTLALKAWADGGSEPGSWQYTGSDSEAGLQTSGTVGIRSSLPSAVTNAPILFTYDSFTADVATPEPSPSPPPNYSLSGRVYEDLDGNGVQDIGEMGYENAVVTIPGIGTDTTDASGDYAFATVPSSTYAVSVTLPSGYINTTSNPATVALTTNTTANFGIQSATTSTIISDTFARSVTDGWGSADTGGSYTSIGTATAFSVNGSEGSMNMTGGGSANQRTMRLDTPRATHIDYTLKVKFDKLPDATNNYIYVIVRHVSSGNEYRGHLRFDTLGQVFLRFSKIGGSSETLLGTEVRATGIAYTPNEWINVHVRATGADPTTLRMNAWPDDGTAEPSSWLLTTTDTATVLQQAGSIGVMTRLGAVSNTPVVASFDDLNVVSSSIVQPTPSPSPTPTPPPTIPFDFDANIDKVFTIVFENQNWSNIIGNTTSAPYINSLLTGINPDGTFNAYHDDVAYANNYRSVVSGETVGGYLHPSLPNYIWMEAGTNAFTDTTFTSDINPGTQSTTSTDHISNQLRLAGKEWRAYQENKPSGCPIGNGTLFTPRHSPFVYFQDVSSLLAPTGVGAPSNSSTYCSARQFDFTQLAVDLGTGGNGGADYNFITPNLCNDMHDSGCAGGEDKVRNGDTWLEDNLSTILESDAYQAGNAVVFVMFDEDAGSTSNNPIGMIAISPKSRGQGYHNTIAYSHSSYVKTVQEIFGLTPLLGHAADAGTQNFADLFGDPVIAAAGDIACGAGSGGASCQQSATAALLSTINPSVILPLGDNQYEQGALTDYQTYYDASWGGAYKALTLPAVGNHEYLTSGAAGHFDYFNGVGSQHGLAGDRTKGYFSYDLGNWRMYALNTNCSQAGGCSAGSPQETWLRADLAANATGKCILAYAHHPMFTSGQQPHNAGVDPLFQALYDYHADVFLAGHDHNYERFYKSNPAGLTDSSGITEFVVGTGGRNFTQLSSNGLAANSAVFDASTFGVLKMTLREDSYEYEFLPSTSGLFTNGTFTETGTESCNYPSFVPSPTPSVAPTPSPSNLTVSGQVYVDTNSNGVQDTTESAYQGATVTLSGTTSGTDTSDVNGEFSFASLPSGTYSVSVMLPTGYFSTTNNPQSISLSSDTSINFGILQSASSFQPTAPYYATFYYNWFKNPTTDGANQWAIWKDSDALGTHNPPDNWFSNYLPTAGLYSSNDYTVFKYQVEKMAEAKQEVAIASWWGQGDRSDVAFEHDITDYMYRSDNPYPNLRWALYYECEGGTCNSTLNPSVSQLVSDLNYIYTHYANEAAYLKVDGKPVIFAYADPGDGGTTDSTCSDTSMTARWAKANSMAIGEFYIVLKVFAGYSSGECQPDSWHQYAPAVRSDQQGSYSYMISPGFWLSGDTVRLPRDLSAFTTVVQSMVAANSTWKLVETWNEWGEGSSVEPGTQVVQVNGNSTAAVDPNGASFGNGFVAALANYLPPLEQGTGVGSSPTPTPSSTPTTYTIDGTLYIDTDSDGVFDGGELGYSGTAAINLSGAQSSATATDSLGGYSFTGLNSGTYTVTATIPAGYVATSTNPFTTSISGDTTVNIGIGLAGSPSPSPAASITISNISVTPSNTSATITWTTDELGDTEIDYGTTTLYSVHQASDGDGTLSHSITTGTLLPCTTYHLRIKSVDLNSASSASSVDQKFRTTGCPGSDAIVSDAQALIPFDTGGILDNRDQTTGDGLRLTIPSGYDTISSVFQSHQLPTSSLASLNKPSSFVPIGDYNYDLQAHPTVTTSVNNFDQPITINITYSAASVAGIDQGTLTVGHYNGTGWDILDDCTINPSVRQVTCTTDTFSVFSLVAIREVSSGGSSSGGGVSSSSICSADVPVASPDLFQVDVTTTTATLYFAPPGKPYDSFFVSYGDGALDEGYGVRYDQSASGGVLSYRVSALSPNSRYTFKVRANNDCMPGPWSSAVTVKTRRSGTAVQRFYPNKTSSVVTTTTPALYTYNDRVKPPVLPSVASTPAPSEKKGFLPQVSQIFAPKSDGNSSGSWFGNIFNGVINYVKKLFGR